MGEKSEGTEGWVYLGWDDERDAGWRSAGFCAEEDIGDSVRSNGRGRGEAD